MVYQKNFRYQTIVNYLIFATLQLIIIAICSLTASPIYLSNKDQRQSIELSQKVLIVFFSLATLLMMVWAVFRIKYSAKANMAISKIQITLHIGSFALYALVYMALLGVFVHNKYLHVKHGNGDTKAEEIDILESSAIIAITLSQIPLLHILNSLVNMGIRDAREENNFKSENEEYE